MNDFNWAIKDVQNILKIRKLWHVKALSHYNVLANVCRRMKNISSTLAYAETEFKKSEKASLWTYTKRMHVCLTYE